MDNIPLLSLSNHNSSAAIISSVATNFKVQPVFDWLKTHYWACHVCVRRGTWREQQMDGRRGGIGAIRKIYQRTKKEGFVPKYLPVGIGSIVSLRGGEGLPMLKIINNTHVCVLIRHI